MLGTNNSRPRRWRFLACGGISVITVAAVIHVAAARAWKQTVAWADAEHRRWVQLDFHRPAAWGNTVPGSAFEAYEQAASIIKDRSELADRVTRELRKRGADPRERNDALARFAPALEALRKGAHAEDARDSFDWSRGFSSCIPNLLVYRNLINIAQARIRQLVDRNEDEEAVRVMLDGAQCGRDLMASPLLITQMIGCALLTVSLDETADRELLERLSRTALAVLHRGLESLDQNLPLIPAAPRVEAALLVRTYQADVPSAEIADCGFDWTNTWRYGFSERWLISRVARAQADYYDECAGLAALPWSKARPAFDEAMQRAAKDCNLAALLPDLVGIELTRRKSTALLRLLRLDVAHRLGREFPLQDPTGDGRLQVSRRPDGVHFRCAAERCGAPIERIAPR